MSYAPHENMKFIHYKQYKHEISCTKALIIQSIFGFRKRNWGNTSKFWISFRWCNLVWSIHPPCLKPYLPQKWITISLPFFSATCHGFFRYPPQHAQHKLPPVAGVDNQIWIISISPSFFGSKHTIRLYDNFPCSTYSPLNKHSFFSQNTGGGVLLKFVKVETSKLEQLFQTPVAPERSRQSKQRTQKLLRAHRCCSRRMGSQDGRKWFFLITTIYKPWSSAIYT